MDCLRLSTRARHSEERRVGEDNVIEQLRARGRRMTISGDDTWAELFDVNATFTSGGAHVPEL